MTPDPYYFVSQQTIASMGKYLQQSSTVYLFVIVLMLAMLRIPFIVFGPGMQDENWFSAPGWTVATEGIPRIPYVPVEDRTSVFYRADDVLFTLPPALFYVQAPFFWAFPATYATARAPSWLAGIVALGLLFAIQKRMGIRDELAIAGVLFCGLSRPFFFAWTNARPDMLCAVFGLAAMLVALHFLDRPSRKLAAIAGLLVGFGMLSHPFAIVFSFQLTVVMLLLNHREIWTKRIEYLAIAGLSAASGLALWLPLVAIDPEAFWVQFSNNVLSRSGPGLVSRILWPWGALVYQVDLFVNRNGIPQTVLLCLSLFSGAAICFFRRDRLAMRSVALAFTALYGHLASVGMHPSIDYWCYTWTWVVLMGTLGLESIATATASFRYRRLVNIAIVISIIAALVPGSGVRPCWTYLTKWGHFEYDRTEFCRRLEKRFPPDSRLIVASDYVFEFETLGRKPVNASRIGIYQDVNGLDFDYWIASRSNTLERLPQSLGCEKLYSFGIYDDNLACYVDVYAAPNDELPRKQWPR